MTDGRFGRTAREQALFEQARQVALAHRAAQASRNGSGLGPADAAAAPLGADALRTLFRALAPTGYLASTLPREAGGHGLAAPEFAALVEGLAPELTLLGNHSVQRYLHRFADEAQQRRFLPPLLAGEGTAAIAMTEGGVGSDLARMATTARRVGAAYVLDGEKTWVTHGLVADLFVILARTEAGLTRFLVPGDTPGLHREALPTVGLRHLGFARLVLTGCEVPATLRLGAEGEGLKGAKAAFPIARVLAGLQAVRIAQAALDIARDYTARHVAGSPLSSSTLVQHGFASLSARCQAAHLLCLRAAARLDADEAVEDSSAAKALAVELAQDACRWTEDLLGSSSLVATHALLALAADARMMAVVDGTAVLNHFVVARRRLGREEGREHGRRDGREGSAA